MSKLDAPPSVPLLEAATAVPVPTGDQLVQAEPDAMQWCRTFWRSMQDRLRRKARELEREAERRDGIAANLNVWVARNFPWVHGSRNAARLDAISFRAAAAICREGSAYARSALADLSADPAGPFIVPAAILERAESATERDGEWTGGDRLAPDTLSAIRIPDVDRLAHRRADLGFPPTFEMTDPEHEGDADARRWSRFFRLDGSVDWPRVIDVTKEVQASLAGRRAARAADAQVAESRDRQRLAEAATASPLHHLCAKSTDGPALVIPFVREGSSGERRNTLDDSDGYVGAPAGEVRTPLQQLVAARQIDAVQAAAGELFAQQFVTADFALGKGTDYALVRGGEMVAEKIPSTEAEEARRWVFAAMDALGGGASPAAMAVWSVVGAQTALDRFARSRHFRMPGGQRWLSVEEAEGVLRQGLAALAAYLTAPTVEHQHRRHGLKVRVDGAVELSFLVGSRRFKVVATYDPARKAWVGHRMAPRKLREGEKTPTEFRHWSVKAVNIAQLAEAAVGAAVSYCRALTKAQ
ncbi:hypothetical protein FHW79_001656 [Azospirillum sp. OGB3]|uniref:hypothetical protein n=1 Tax=Azospirillum sp. OGB3 TaxID=2587012 RepID=UPI0016065EAF|nr:hypothetical protein [Azospirillum sp. OGB3]MBB3264041.1 hypothetical protein [Azospirillum sp. OGB3]